MTYRIQTKKSDIAALKPHPSELLPGELAVNYSDMVLYALGTDGAVHQISGSGGGGDCTNCPEYYGPQTEEPADGMKKGDIWFESDGSLRAASQSKSLPKRTAQLKRVVKTLKKKSGKLPTRTKEIKKLRRR